MNVGCDVSWMHILILLSCTIFTNSTVKALSLHSNTIRRSSNSDNNVPTTLNVSQADKVKEDVILQVQVPAIRRIPVRYRGRAAYDGSMFKGWQVQDGTKSKGKGNGKGAKTNTRTVQGEIERVLSMRFNRAVKIVGAGRTDAGVHARGQAFHFDLYPERDHSEEGYQEEGEGKGDDGERSEFCTNLQKSMNSMLPEDVRVWNISRCPPPEMETTKELLLSGNDNSNNKGNGEHLQETKTTTRARQWHVIYKATKKLYVYRISMGPNAITSDPLQRYQRVHIEGGEDIKFDQLENILKHYEGTHDFRAFAGAIEANQRRDGVENKNTVRTVYDVSLFDEGNGNYRIHILLKGALYKMVRNMVGTALDVCRGRLGEDQMLEMLHHSNAEGSKLQQFVRKDNKCKPAPPEGLTLEKVYFDDDF